MATQTSLVAQQVRLKQWAEQIKECQNRPEGMDVKTWCTQNNITKANYYYRLRRVREACLGQILPRILMLQHRLMFLLQVFPFIKHL